MDNKISFADLVNASMANTESNELVVNYSDRSRTASEEREPEKAIMPREERTKRGYDPYEIPSFDGYDYEAENEDDFDYDVYGNRIDRSSQKPRDDYDHRMRPDYRAYEPRIMHEEREEFANDKAPSYCRPRQKRIDRPADIKSMNTDISKMEEKSVAGKVILSMFLVSALVVLIVIALIFAKKYTASINDAAISEAVTNSSNLMIDNSQSEANGEAVEKKNATSPMFTATGYYDCEINKGDCIYLSNDAENKTEEYDIYLQYIITEVTNTDGEVPILTTGLIEPGMQVSWSPAEELKEGIHKIHMVEQPYTLEGNGEFVPRFSCDQTINITIK